jgi:hypothetical protein
MSEQLAFNEDTQVQIAPTNASTKQRQATRIALANLAGLTEAHLAQWGPSGGMPAHARRVLFVALQPNTDQSASCEAILESLGPIFGNALRPDVVPVGADAGLLEAVRALGSQVYPSLSQRPLISWPGVAAIVLSLIGLALWEWMRR